jgi:hypothetical protein
MEMIQARLANLMDESFRTKGQRWEGFQAGGGGKVEKEQVLLTDAHVTVADGQVVATFTKDGGNIEATLEALELPLDWQHGVQLNLSVTNGKKPLRLTFSVLGARCRLIEVIDLAGNEQRTLAIDLADLPLAQANRPPYRPTGIRISVQWGKTWNTEGERLCAGSKWPATARNRPVTLTIQSLVLAQDADRKQPAIVDEFGQRIHADWPTKVRNQLHMKKVVEEENQWLAATPGPADRDIYGGWTKGPKFEASGFFRVQQDTHGRWWYVDPLGHPFWSIGTTGVRTTDNTIITGREHFFEGLPDPKGPFAEVYGSNAASDATEPDAVRMIRFYHLNVLRKYGNKEAWRDQVTRRFRAWGFNTIANWSEDLVMAQTTVPHTRNLTSRFPGAPKVNHRMPDVWDPEWVERLDDEVRRAASLERNNPWLLGYFCDNEMGWGSLHRNIFDCPEDAPAREAFCEFVSRRYATLETFNLDFRTSFENWEDTGDLDPEDLPEDGPSVDVMRDFVGEYADRYFRIVTSLLKKHDPNHLYLGCRFVRGKPDTQICKAAGRYSDVVTVNCYDLWPRREQFSDWYADCGRPIQIGEHHMPLFTQRQLPPLYPAFTEAERRTLYVQFVRRWAEQPYSLGCHWFQHADQHVTGRPSDGENQPVGFVDITDRPHPELSEAAQEATASLYQWHAESQ